jgi:uncharacterized protein (TIGR00661 family)
MARIIFGVCGDGRGHSTRSKVVIDYLISKGHQVKILTNRVAYAYFNEIYDDVVKISGLELVYKDQKVDFLRTAFKNIKNTTLTSYDNLRTFFSEVWSFKPDFAITDFEPIVSLFARSYNIPCYNFNNQNIITNCKYSYLNSYRKYYVPTYAVIKNLSAFSKRYMITSFFKLPVKRNYLSKTKLVGPILRPEIFKKKASDKGYVLVYVTTPESREVLKFLEYFDLKFIAYGFNGEKDTSNVVFKEPDMYSFLDDVAGAKAIICNGGHSLICEALFLGKPIYSIPLKNTFEQIINGVMIEKKGYGLYNLNPSFDRLNMFFDGLGYYKKNIKRDKENFCGNYELFNYIDGILKKY